MSFHKHKTSLQPGSDVYMVYLLSDGSYAIEHETIDTVFVEKNGEVRYGFYLRESKSPITVPMTHVHRTFDDALEFAKTKPKTKRPKKRRR